MSSSKKQYKQSTRAKIVENLLDGFDVVGELLTLPPYSGPRYNFEYHMAEKEWQKVYGADLKQKRALREMRKRKWITDRKKGDGVIVKLHSDVIVSHLKDRILQKTKQIPNEKVCLLSFDFPNGATKARNKWRGLIRRLGLVKEQLSLYSTKFDIADELVALIKVLELERWIRVFVAREKLSSV
ncbi:MAG TPA: hypothetical protein VJB64_03110 [Patescibacteria group bacterium]|nr:hypothetical protein [Patescibacteria group bacterium]